MKKRNQGELIAQVKDFFAYCDSDIHTHTYDRIYSARKLMQALEAPYLWDITWNITSTLTKLFHNDMLHGHLSTVDRYNIEELKKLVISELDRQAMQFAGVKDKSVIAPIDIEKIYEEYTAFVREQKKQEKDVVREIKKDAIVINPYEYMHKGR